MVFKICDQRFVITEVSCLLPFSGLIHVLKCICFFESLPIIFEMLKKEISDGDVTLYLVGARLPGTYVEKALLENPLTTDINAG